jgi:hypothetical protein
MPGRSRSSRNKNKPRGGGGLKKTARAVDRELVNSSYVVGRAEVIFPKADLEAPLPDWKLTQHPPSLRGNITWVVGRLQTILTISNSVPTENNVAFRLSDLVDLVGLAAFFDQYCIYAVTVNVTPNFEGAGSTLYTFGTCVTAIDYDNINNLGSLQAIEAFQTAETFEMAAGQSIQRFIKPAVAPALYTTGSPALAGYSVQRMWVDSSDTGVPHYGFRSFFVSNTVAGNSVVNDFTYVVGFRNNM